MHVSRPYTYQLDPYGVQFGVYSSWRVAVRRVLPVSCVVHFSRFLYMLTHSALHKEMNNVEM